MILTKNVVYMASVSSDVDSSLMFSRLDDEMRTADDLSRLDQFDGMLGTAYIRRQACTKIMAVAEAALKEIEKGTSSFEVVHELFELKLKKCPDRIQEYYEPLLREIHTIEDLRLFAQQTIANIVLMSASPIVLSNRGIKGPTFLVSFLKDQPHPHQACVIKWMDSDEFVSNCVYKKLAKCPATDSEALHDHGFDVPISAELDFNSSVFEGSDGTHETLGSSDKERLESIFQEITQHRDPSHRVHSRQLLLCERIKGANLFDFAHAEYLSLSLEEKKKLFIRMGRLALLDVIVGNLDRLIQISDWDGSSNSRRRIFPCK